MRTWIVKQLFQVFSGLCHRDQNVMQTLGDKQHILKKNLERKAELAVRGEKLAQQIFSKLRQTWKSKIGK